MVCAEAAIPYAYREGGGLIEPGDEIPRGTATALVCCSVLACLVCADDRTRGQCQCYGVNFSVVRGQHVTHQTAIQSSIEAYLSCEDDPPEDRAEQEMERNQRLLRFPYAVMLQVSYAEVDFANRWCWLRFGHAHGECRLQKDSEYRVCPIDEPHSHSGVWTAHWFVKTAYNFGFCEWYFDKRSHYDQFLEFVPRLNWGENYPK